MNEFIKNKIILMFMFRNFDVINGKLYWKIKPKFSNIEIGDEVGWKEKNGYRRVSINFSKMLVHRILFLLYNGYMPEFIDHINGIKDDNTKENLRECTSQQNKFNSGIMKTNTSGAKNVFYNHGKNCYVVLITVNGRLRKFGHFDSISEAIICATESRKRYHKEFANHG